METVKPQHIFKVEYGDNGEPHIVPNEPSDDCTYAVYNSPTTDNQMVPQTGSIEPQMFCLTTSSTRQSIAGRMSPRTACPFMTRGTCDVSTVYTSDGSLPLLTARASQSLASAFDMSTRTRMDAMVETTADVTLK